jgi:phosphohistidine phosphatase SixA
VVPTIVPPVTIYLVRHAHAGTRGEWPDGDDLRPLSKRGTQQAIHVATVLGDRPIKRLYSSPSRRCLDTLRPLADRLGLDIKQRTELFEGADPNQAIAFMMKQAGHNPAFSTHGDLIPQIVRRLIAAGMRTTDANISQKGSVWELEVRKGSVVAGRYHPPST